VEKIAVTHRTNEDLVEPYVSGCQVSRVLEVSERGFFEAGVRGKKIIEGSMLFYGSGRNQRPKVADAIATTSS